MDPLRKKTNISFLICIYTKICNLIRKVNDITVRYALQVEFAGGALRCGEYVTLRKVTDASQKVRTS